MNKLNQSLNNFIVTLIESSASISEIGNLNLLLFYSYEKRRNKNKLLLK